MAASCMCIGTARQMSAPPHLQIRLANDGAEFNCLCGLFALHVALALMVAKPPA